MNKRSKPPNCKNTSTNTSAQSSPRNRSSDSKICSRAVAARADLAQADRVDLDRVDRVDLDRVARVVLDPVVAVAADQVGLPMMAPGTAGRRAMVRRIAAGVRLDREARIL